MSIQKYTGTTLYIAANISSSIIEDEKFLLSIFPIMPGFFMSKNLKNMKLKE